jgi:hypothetical protein
MLATTNIRLIPRKVGYGQHSLDSRTLGDGIREAVRGHPQPVPSQPGGGFSSQPQPMRAELSATSSNQSVSVSLA